MLIDVHAHMDHFSSAQLAGILERAHNVKAIISTSTDVDDSIRVLKLAVKYDKIKASLGLYPQAKNFGKFDEIKRLIMDNKEDIIQIGEIGMDFYHEPKETEKEQSELFRAQLELARELGLPVSVHARAAEKEVLDILEDYSEVVKILHCFCGNMKLVKRGIDMGCYFSITTAIDRMQNFQKMLEIIPREKVLTETDAPYLTPRKHGDKPNEAAYIMETILKIGEIWGEPASRVEDIIESNANRIFEM